MLVYIKLGLDDGILNLSLVEFILIYLILGLVDCVCIFLLLIWMFWAKTYSNLGSF